MLRPLVVVALVGALSACTKSANEYYQIEADYSNLVARDSDDAYLAEAMDDILTRLRAIPPDVKESAKVADLLAKIDTERTRVKGEREAAKKAHDDLAAVRPGPPPEFLPPPPDAGPPPEVAVPDAGSKPPLPFAGMKEADFLKYYERCVEAGEKVKLSLAPEPGNSWVLKKDEACEQQLSAEGGVRSYVFIDAKLAGAVDRIVTVTVVDAGARPPPPPPPPSDGGEPILFRIPGAPTEAPPPQPMGQ